MQSRDVAARAGEGVMDTAGIGSIPFPEAARAWLESRKDFLAKSTYRDYVVYIRTLGKFSYGTVWRLLNALVERGLAHREISPADGILRYGPVKVECTHERIACKDCGVTISPEGGLDDHVKTGTEGVNESTPGQIPT
jgi:hypothetical protein